MFQERRQKEFPFLVLLFASLLVIGFVIYYVKVGSASESKEPSQENNKNGLKPAEWFYAAREFPDFKTELTTYRSALNQVAAQTSDRNNTGFTAPWRVEGPGNIGARINCIAVNPANQNIIYIGYSTGGAWKTTDGGTTWNPIFDGQTALSIGHIAIDPSNPNIVYIGTGDPNVSGYPFIGDGLWKSTNGGSSWTHLGLSETAIISKIAISPANSNTIYVATMGLPMERTPDRGLYKTTDGGLSWQKILYIGEETGVIDLILHPTNANIAYAASWDRIRNNQESLVSGENAKIWKTTNAGLNWTALSGGLPTGNYSRIGLGMAPDSPDHLYATYVGQNLDFAGVYETANGGATWTENPGNNIDPGFMGGFGWYFGKIHINPFNKLDIWIPGITGMRSVNGGQTWDYSIPWDQDVHADKHDMVFLNATTALLATDGGLYKTTNGGTTWAKIENIPTTQFYRVAYNPHDPLLYIGGAQDNGTLVGNASLINNWDRIFGGDGFQAVFHPTDPGIFYCEYQNGGISGYDAGSGWFNPATDGIEPTDRFHWDMQYIMSPHDPDIMYTGTHRVYMSISHPPYWFPVSDDLTDGVVFEPRFHNITTLHESPILPDLLYIGTTDGNVWRGSPSQQQWTNITGSLPDRYVSSVKASPNFSDKVYVTHTGYKSNDFAPHIHRSDNKGNTWVPIAGNLPNIAINDVFVLPGHQDSVIFVATDGGVFGTLNAGTSWDRLGTGMPIVPVYDIDRNPTENTLIAGTHGRSIMSFPLDSLVFETGVYVQQPTQNEPLITAAPTLVQDFTAVTINATAPLNALQYEIWNMGGQLKGEGKINEAANAQPYRISTKTLSPGSYLLLIKNNKKIIGSSKLVKPN